MDFIGIGPVQLMVILVVAFFVLGPERLPEVARTLARAIRTLRSYASDVQDQFEGEIGGLREEFGSIQRDLSSMQGSLRGGLAEIDSSLRSVAGEVNGVVSDTVVSFEQARDARLNGGGASVEAQTATPTSPGAIEYRPETPQRPSVTPVTSPLLASAPAPPTAGAESRLPDYRPPA